MVPSVHTNHTREPIPGVGSSWKQSLSARVLWRSWIRLSKVPTEMSISWLKMFWIFGQKCLKRHRILSLFDNRFHGRFQGHIFLFRNTPLNFCVTLQSTGYLPCDARALNAFYHWCHLMQVCPTMASSMHGNDTKVRRTPKTPYSELQLATIFVWWCLQFYVHNSEPTLKAILIALYSTFRCYKQSKKWETHMSGTDSSMYHGRHVQANLDLIFL